MTFPFDAFALIVGHGPGFGVRTRPAQTDAARCATV
jgi:hypothetical protein